ncbi:hypothetical protein ERX46_04100 [Brumimicrobium glaciale]|uniref:DUF3108 domain-containing protein n=1 Tax=Brumimicrobium glaciale TaxID=200475 RepID=A0A4Q4KPU8_9FLAO|nr:hypothetical protein [Brumimicrobium glaciale]RYM34564.1 hypothetical protein ERX46_04100 [Brumimicrobium glaciale]
MRKILSSVIFCLIAQLCFAQNDLIGTKWTNTRELIVDYDTLIFKPEFSYYKDSFVVNVITPKSTRKEQFIINEWCIFESHYRIKYSVSSRKRKNRFMYAYFYFEADQLMFLPHDEKIPFESIKEMYGWMILTRVEE